MKFYFPIAKVDAEERMVWGYASTEALDEQGESVRRAALAAALDDYMRFANIREMHQLSAVGRAQEAGIDDKGLYIGARIVDPVAWAKVREGVYNGFSIGGKVTARDAADRRVITALQLDEISLVDRPANPEAVFDCWKAQRDGMKEEPVQIWHCGIDGHRHAAKAAAATCIETRPGRSETAIAKAGDAACADPGYQPDGKPRYPIDSERHIRAAWLFIHRPRNAQRYTPQQLEAIKSRIAAAWRERIDRDGPPAAREDGPEPGAGLHKALSDVGQIAGIILDLAWLKERLAVEAALEGDLSAQPLRLQAVLDELCDFLNALVAEETGEIGGSGDRGVDAGGVAMVAGGGDGRLYKLARPHGGAIEAGRAEKAALAEALGDIVPRLDALARRVEEIAAMPLPPLTIAKGGTALSKQQDAAGPQSSDELAAAFARMSPEEQTMTLIKASQRNPIRMPA